MVKTNKEIDEVFSEAGLQEKLYCWFNKYRKQACMIFGSFFVILLLAVCWSVMRSNRVHTMQQQYLTLSDTDSKLSFIKKYRASSLCGVVLLNLGDEADSRGDFKAASSYYELAAKALRKCDIHTRADISRASSELQAGNSGAFEKILSDILYNEKLASHFRADALSKLTGYFRSIGDDIKVSELLHCTNGLNISDGWREYVLSLAK